MAEPDLAALAAQLGGKELAPGEILMRQGDDADGVFILIDGRLTVTLEREEDDDETHIADLEPGTIVGEIALVAGGRRTATVRASERSRLAAIDPAGFNRLLEDEPEVAARLSAIAAQRMREVQLTVELARLFGGLGAVELDALVKVIEWMTLDAGKTLFRQGESADCAYLVVSGRLAARAHDGNGDERLVGEVGRGEMVGEYGVLLDEPRGATVVALRDTDLARIPRDTFDDLVQRFPKILLELTRTIIRRSSTSIVQARRRRDEQRTIGIVPLSPGVLSDGFADALAVELSRHRTSILLSSQRLDVLLEKPGIAQSASDHPAGIRVRHWLANTESTHALVVYQADDGETAWSERTMRHSDRLIFVADATDDEQLRAIERRQAQRRQMSRQSSSLVLVHPQETDRPRNTADWLADRDVDAVYHVRRGNSADIARLARILAGRGLGLVLGGGGARGFAHLGVLRVLEELGIPVDMIGGTSIGAPLALTAAQGLTAAQSLAVVAERFRSLFDFTLPLTSLLVGQRISDSIIAHAGSWDIEDLWLPFFCVSTDITRSREVRHRRGSLVRAVRASVSIPGVLPPVPDQGSLLVDGGVMNNLPIDAMRELNPTGPIIAIDVVPEEGPSLEPDYGLAVSGWRLAVDRIRKRRRSRLKAPAVGYTILRSILVGSDRTREQLLDAKLADLYLDLCIAGVGLLEFERVEEIAQRGYELSREPIRRWIEEGGLGV